MLLPLASHSEALRQTMTDLAPFFGPRCAPLIEPAQGCAPLI